MKRYSLFLLLIVTFFYRCGSSNDRGELVGAKTKTKWYGEKPYGMVLIPGGSFTMGSQDEDVSNAFNTPTRTVTVRPFYMDETEITNSEYKEFVFWVRDSVVRTKLALLAEELAYGKEPSKTGIQRFQFKNIDTTKASPYVNYMLKNYGSLGDFNSPTQGKLLNWKEKLDWSPNRFTDEYYAEVMDTMFVPIDESINGRRMIDVKKLNYGYAWIDIESAARTAGNRREFIVKEVVNIYPDTTVWVKDFNYSYNDPMHQDYFWHEAYTEYPVVGVSWKQAKAFSNWRTKKKNDYLRSTKRPSTVPQFRLPTEAEWEYAARGGLNFAVYPWGGPYTTTDRGCFLANFKPSRGDYAVDGALYTMEAKSYNPNGYGLYNMSGNVSEWTNTAYNESSYNFGATMNPNVEDAKNNRKVIRGGSWKDVAYFLQVSSRDFEYGDCARSYIGFRTVHDYLGTTLTGKKTKTKKTK